MKPTSEEFLFTDTDKKDKLSVAIMKKLNSSLGQYDIQVSKDTDVPDPTVLGFFIPLPAGPKGRGPAPCSLIFCISSWIICFNFFNFMINFFTLYYV